MEFKVYHSRNWALNSKLHFMESEKLCPECKDGYKPFRSNYKAVAMVESDSIGMVFQYTNHIDRAWWENKNVRLIEESRSTSVGDLVEDETGQLWVCASVGWEKCEWNETDYWKVHKDEFGEYIVPMTEEDLERLEKLKDLRWKMEAAEKEFEDAKALLKEDGILPEVA